MNIVCMYAGVCACRVHFVKYKMIKFPNQSCHRDKCAINTCVYDFQLHTEVHTHIFL